MEISREVPFDSAENISSSTSSTDSSALSIQEQLDTPSISTSFFTQLQSSSSIDFLAPNSDLTAREIQEGSHSEMITSVACEATVE